MKKNFPIQVTIANPCRQSWAEMTPVDGGRHCMSCQKVVTDFTRMGDADIIAYLQSQPFSCGRFREDQLDRNLTFPPAKVLPMMKWYVSLLLLLGWSKDGYAQAKPVPKQRKHQAPVGHSAIKDKPSPEKSENPSTDSVITTARPPERTGGPTINTNDIVSLSVGRLQPSGGNVYVTGARSAPTTYVIDGIQLPGAPVNRKPSFWKRIWFWKN